MGRMRPAMGRMRTSSCCSEPWRANVPRAGALPRNPGAARGQAMGWLGVRGKQTSTSSYTA